MLTLENKNPLVSIVLTTFNSQAIIERVLEAIVNQDFPLERVELIIVDGGSKDKTLKIIQDFLERNAHRFYEVKIITHDKNYGVSKARNDGIRASKGKYLLILDHDVVMRRETLNSLVKYLERSSEKVGCVKPLFHVVKGRLLNKWLEKILENRITKHNTIADCTLIKREVINKIGYYDETLGPPHTICEEREYGARAEAGGYEIHMIGWIKVDHYTGVEDDNVNAESSNRHEANRILKRLIPVQLIIAFRQLCDSEYRQALRKWIASMSSLKKLKWMLYSTIMPSLAITSLTTLALGTPSPLLLWFFITFTLYIDVLRQYWNPKIPHISIAYSFTAFLWRVVRSLVLLTPK